MGLLRATSTGVEHPLASRTLVGRSAACTLRLSEPLASAEHAAISWTESGWAIRDLGSKNGTYLRAERLEPGRGRMLSLGSELGFGERSGWTLTDAGPPSAIAFELASGELRAAEGGLLALPSPSAPLISVHQSQQGWILEDSEGDSKIVSDQEIVQVGGRSWRLNLPVALEGTPMADPRPALEVVRFRFEVSRNEEFVRLWAAHGSNTIDLGTHEHHYILLTLARARAEDTAAELPAAERGWIERSELLRMLSIGANALNVGIHRARAQLIAAGVEGAAALVEVRGQQRRFGTDRFHIETT